MSHKRRAAAVTETDEGILVAIRVVPRSYRPEVIGWKEEELWVRLTKPPVEGEANQELLRTLAKFTGLSLSSVKLVSGEKSLHKRVKFLGLEKETFLRMSHRNPDSDLKLR